MTAAAWRLTAYDLPAGRSSGAAPGAYAFVYAASGRGLVGGSRIETGDGVFAAPGDEIRAESGDVWVFEADPVGRPPRGDEALRPVLSRVAPPPAADGLILRADLVESDAGARTPAHRHRGPGLRRLVSGLLLAELDDRLDRVGPGGGWFETGLETVVGTNISGGPNAFVRVMLLPASLEGGQTSFVPATPVDATKPRAARVRLFGEMRCT